MDSHMIRARAALVQSPPLVLYVMIPVYLSPCAHAFTMLVEYFGRTDNMCETQLDQRLDGDYYDK